MSASEELSKSESKNDDNTSNSEGAAPIGGSLFGTAAPLINPAGVPLPFLPQSLGNTKPLNQLPGYPIGQPGFAGLSYPNQSSYSLYHPSTIPLAQNYFGGFGGLGGFHPGQNLFKAQQATPPSSGPLPAHFKSVMNPQMIKFQENKEKKSLVACFCYTKDLKHLSKEELRCMHLLGMPIPEAQKDQQLVPTIFGPNLFPPLGGSLFNNSSGAPNIPQSANPQIEGNIFGAPSQNGGGLFGRAPSGIGGLFGLPAPLGANNLFAPPPPGSILFGTAPQPSLFAPLFPASNNASCSLFNPNISHVGNAPKPQLSNTDFNMKISIPKAIDASEIELTSTDAWNVKVDAGDSGRIGIQLKQQGLVITMKINSKGLANNGLKQALQPPQQVPVPTRSLFNHSNHPTTNNSPIFGSTPVPSNQAPTFPPPSTTFNASQPKQAPQPPTPTVTPTAGAQITAKSPSQVPSLFSQAKGPSNMFAISKAKESPETEQQIISKSQPAEVPSDASNLSKAFTFHTSIDPSGLDADQLKSVSNFRIWNQKVTVKFLAPINLEDKKIEEEFVLQNNDTFTVGQFALYPYQVFFQSFKTELPLQEAIEKLKEKHKLTNFSSSLFGDMNSFSLEHII